MHRISSSSSSISNNATPIFQVPSLSGNRYEDIFVHQDRTPPGHFFPNLAIDNVTDSPLLENFADNLYSHDQNKINMSANLNHYNYSADPSMGNLIHPRWKKPDVNYSSKDRRRRKIVTAQGPRDRRVRLSIQIARQFFDLQDTLGFDKASKTLDWLLTKSKSAIEEAVKTKHTNAAIQQKKVMDEIGNNFQRSSLVIPTTSTTTKSNVMRQQNSSYLVAKELRAKARERARQRTKAKISIRKLHDLNKLGSGFGPIFPNSWNHQLSSHNNVPYFNTSQQNDASSKEVPLVSPSLITENWDMMSNNFLQNQQQIFNIYMAAGYMYQ